MKINETPLHTLLQWTKSRTLTPNAGEDAEQEELTFIANGNVKWYSDFWKTVWPFLTRLNIYLTHYKELCSLEFTQMN